MYIIFASLLQFNRSDVLKYSGGLEFLNHYYGNLPKALSAIYPSTVWFSNRFPSLSSTTWEQVSRKFFEQMAKERGITTSEQWYLVKKEDILKRDGGEQLLKHYCGSIAEALEDAYPGNLYIWGK